MQKKFGEKEYMRIGTAKKVHFFDNGFYFCNQKLLVHLISMTTKKENVTCVDCLRLLKIDGEEFTTHARWYGRYCRDCGRKFYTLQRQGSVCVKCKHNIYRKRNSVSKKNVISYYERKIRRLAKESMKRKR